MTAILRDLRGCHKRRESKTVPLKRAGHNAMGLNCSNRNSDSISGQTPEEREQQRSGASCPRRFSRRGWRGVSLHLYQGLDRVPVEALSRLTSVRTYASASASVRQDACACMCAHAAAAVFVYARAPKQHARPPYNLPIKLRKPFRCRTVNEMLFINM